MVAMATVHEKNSNNTFNDNTGLILMKFHMMVIQDLAKEGHDPKFKMGVMPIYGNNIQTTSFSEPLGQFG